MSTTKNPVLLLSAAAFVLIGCSTVQENPNYQYSSKYGVTEAVQTAQVEPVQDATPTVVSANNPSATLSPTEQAYNADQMMGTPGYAILMAEEAERNARQAQQAQQAPSYPHPQSHALPVPELVYGTPREVAYDYAENEIQPEPSQPTGRPVQLSPQPAPQPSAPTSTAVTAATNKSYVVKPGDTVYSLSRRFCAPISDIIVANGIGSDFAIAIGETLIIPDSRC